MCYPAMINCLPVCSEIVIIVTLSVLLFILMTNALSLSLTYSLSPPSTFSYNTLILKYTMNKLLKKSHFSSRLQHSLIPRLHQLLMMKMMTMIFSMIQNIFKVLASFPLLSLYLFFQWLVVQWYLNRAVLYLKRHHCFRI